MKKTIYVISGLLLLILLVESCEDLQEVETPQYEVAFSTTAKVGEPIEFMVENAPNFLSFYSGEFGHEYKNRTRTNAEGIINMSFDSSQNWQNGISRSTQSLSVQVSSDYDGTGTPEAIANATWTDISDRFTLATDRTYDYTNSGIADITDLAADGKPVFIAFKIYAIGKVSEGNRQGEYRLDNFNIELAVSGESYSLPKADMTTPGFNMVNVAGFNDNTVFDHWVLWDNDFYRIKGEQADYTNEDWLITEPINLTGVTPDIGISLKTYSAQLETFRHTYTEAGTYTVTFVGSNETIYGKKSDVKEFTITVTD
ncbi:DUF5017 domain-containing protein [Flavivirga sp. 57AJ16]|uniref:DUF5017 domain-containing protein n=1 Tax=Flavivirga sp. 57AJ16 TaxID=3025307 RepID=UPI0023660FEB|nr:DUF5017 domain-containing protein [Flavivirga sp. 57AJ16]MDD7887838.1 DUF5017 domain-containing protein [Flavivirga sp. 57AJ16]